MTIVQKTCEWCGSQFEFDEYPSDVKAGKGRYCSQSCRVRAVSKKRWEKHQEDPSEWFWDRVDKSGGPKVCWPWKGRKLEAGYGRLTLRGKSIGAHRVALQLKTGESGEGLFACHKCDNPECCNPDHLFWGTPQDNMDDCCSKGRQGGKARKFNYAEAIQLFESGWSKGAISRKFGVHISTVSGAIKRTKLAALKAKGGEG